MYSYKLLREDDITFIQCIHKIFCGKSILLSYNALIKSSEGKRHYLHIMYSYNLLREGHYLHTIYSCNLLQEGGITFVLCIHTVLCGKATLHVPSYNVFIQSSAGRTLPSYNLFMQSSAGRRHYFRIMYSYSLLWEGDITCTFIQCILHTIICGKAV